MPISAFRKARCVGILDSKQAPKTTRHAAAKPASAQATSTAKTIVAAVVQFGDAHFGSLTGLMPPGFKTLDGHTVGQNRSQAYIWSCYLDFLEHVKAYSRFARVFTLLMGDLVEGVHHNTVEIFTEQEEEQQRAAVEGLELLVGLSNGVEAIAGTPTHVGQQSRSERAVLKDLQRAGYKVAEHAPASIVWPVISLEIGGVRIRAAHHGRTSMIEHNASNWLNAKLRTHVRSCQDNGEPWPDWLLFGHTHLKAEAVYAPGFGDRRRIRGLISGCWQLPTGFGHKGFPFVPTHIGANIIEIYSDGTSDYKEFAYPTFAEERKYTVIPIGAGRQAVDGGRVGERDRQPTRAAAARRGDAGDSGRAVKRRDQHKGSA